MIDHVRLAVASVSDIVAARRHGRRMALALGFTAPDSTLITSAISELARNIILYAHTGAILLRTARGRARNRHRVGLIIIARDRGPGIDEVERALLGGYSTSGGLGLGLSGVGRIMDDLAVRSRNGRGTTVIATKWLQQ